MNIIRIFFEFLPLLLLVIGVPLFFVLRRRRLAKMTPAERAMHRAEEQRWLDDQVDPTNLLGTTNPYSPLYPFRDGNDD